MRTPARKDAVVPAAASCAIVPAKAGLQGLRTAHRGALPLRPAGRNERRAAAAAGQRALRLGVNPLGRGRGEGDERRGVAP